MRIDYIKRSLPKSIKERIRPLYYKIFGAPRNVDLDSRWVTMREKLYEAKKIIDLGCGPNPVRGASVGVDCHLAPLQRGLGSEHISVERMRLKGTKFLHSRIDVPLPFKDKEFDFAYSHHVFEHLDDPATACKEMMRIAKSGVIITPSTLAEFIFGRSYHKWLTIERNNTIFFFRKREVEDRPFGNVPKWDEVKKKLIINKDTNPFDILLNEGGRYSGKENMPRLANILRKYWYCHSQIIEVIFLWEESFEYKIFC